MHALKKVKPYHQMGATARGGAYHDRSDCPIGRRIFSEDLVPGAKGLHYCDECRALEEAANPVAEPGPARPPSG